MKRLILLISLTVVASISFYAQNMKDFKLSFNAEDFHIEYNDKEEGLISFSSLDYIYDEDTSLPCLPYTMVNVAISSNLKFSSIEIVNNKTLFSDNIVLSHNPEIVSTNIQGTMETKKDIQYKNTIYPDTQVEYVGTNELGDYSIITFRVTPFEYNSRNKKLFFSDVVNLSVSLCASKSNTIEYKKNLISAENLREMVINPEDVVCSSNYATSSVQTEESVDYLIITNSELRDAFTPLVEWKKMKGVRTEIVTIDEIDSDDQYSNETTIQLKMKRCFQEYFNSRNLKYVLLGGDDSVVPVQGCYGKVRSFVCMDIPSDLFYACFGEPFDWDLNGDGIYGKEDDNVGMIPSISITRAPVRTIDDVTAFVNKTLYYEKTPSLNGWNNQMLMCGGRLDYNDDNHINDVEIKGNKLYDHISGNWNGSRMRLYNTYSDFPGGASYDFTPQHLQDQITNGYSLIDVITHGMFPSTAWDTECGLYTPYLASQSESGQPSIITTVACHSNAFDSSYDPCLSESFIRNPNNGVVAYLGSSREGWYSSGDEFGTSLSYEYSFYLKLFDDIHSKSFGDLVAETKRGKAITATYGDSYRWIQYALNPIGDAEMQIITSTPVYFENVSITDDGNNLSIDTRTPGCKICLMSTDDMGHSYYEVRENVQSAIFSNVANNVSICITKHNYIPYISNRGDLYIQNETITDTQTIEADNIIIGSHVTTSKPYGPVQITGDNIAIRGNVVKVIDSTTLGPNTTINSNNN